MTENKVICTFSKIKNVENDGLGMMKHKIKIIKFKKKWMTEKNGK